MILFLIKTSHNLRLLWLKSFQYFLCILTGVFLTQCGPSPEFDIYKNDGTLKPTQRPYSIKDRTYYPQEHYEYDTTGIASWYGPGFHGRMTSTGDVFDENRLTAAHNTLPLPCVVRVTNLENNRVILLEVNDRGPFAKERIIDVSRRGAQLLGFMNKGTAEVRVECLAQESRLLNQRYRMERAQRLQNRQKLKAAKALTKDKPEKLKKPHLEIDQKFIKLIQQKNKIVALPGEKIIPLKLSVEKTLQPGLPLKLPQKVNTPKSKPQNISPPEMPRLRLSASTLNMLKTIPSKPPHKNLEKPSNLPKKPLLSAPKIQLNPNLPGQQIFVSLGMQPTAEKAKQLAKKFISKTNVKVLQSPKGFEVRLGPIKTMKQAEIMVKQLIKTYKNIKIVK